PFGRCAECGGTLHSIEKSDPSACARADIEDPASAADGLNRRIHHLRNLGDGGCNGAGHNRVLSIDDSENPLCRKEVDVDRARVAPFCSHLKTATASIFYNSRSRSIFTRQNCSW